MTPPIAINGTRLDEVRMPMVPYTKNTLAFLSYPTGQLHVSLGERDLQLIVPANLAVELYRIGILPQDPNIPVEVSIGGRMLGPCVVSDVRYPNIGSDHFGKISFTFTRVPQDAVRNAGTVPAQARTRVKAPGMFIADITHYLDEAGELAQMPRPAQKLATFLTLLIETATAACPGRHHDSGVPCRKKACRGTIQTILANTQDEIFWECPACGRQGTISNWQDTKWNRLNRCESAE